MNVFDALSLSKKICHKHKCTPVHMYI